MLPVLLQATEVASEQGAEAPDSSQVCRLERGTCAKRIVRCMVRWMVICIVSSVYGIDSSITGILVCERGDIQYALYTTHYSVPK
jgi:hypothetical protein